MIAFGWFGCVGFMLGKKYYAKCRYSICNLIVHAMRYILLLFLFVDGCVCSKLGMGPWLVSMSPLRNNSRGVDIFVFCGRFFFFMFLVVFVFMRAKFVMWLRRFVFLWCLFCIFLFV